MEYCSVCGVGMVKDGSGRGFYLSGIGQLIVRFAFKCRLVILAQSPGVKLEAGQVSRHVVIMPSYLQTDPSSA